MSVSSKIRLRRLHTSGLPYERPRATRALWWGAPQAADPPTPGPEKHKKSFRRVGERFLDGIRVAHKRLQEHSPHPVLRVPKIGKKRRFDTFFGRFFAFRKVQNAVNYSIFAFYRLLREPCKNAENAVNTNTFWTRDAQSIANTSVFESTAKKHCKLQHFWRVDRKKWWSSQGFCNFKKTWKARNTVNSGVLATFGRRNAGIYAVFCPWRRQTPVNYSIFFPFWADLLRWWTQKMLVFTRF